MFELDDIELCFIQCCNLEPKRMFLRMQTRQTNFNH